MPFISTKTNVNVPKEKEIQLKERLGQAIAIIPGKSESWLMLAIEGDVPMYFRGDDSAPTAFIEVKIFGSASPDAYSRMTKEELLELVSRQNDAINSLDAQRYDASAVIEHLVQVTHEMHNLRYHDADRSHCQDRVDDWISEMYTKYPIYIVSAEKVNARPENAFEIKKENDDEDTNS